MCLSVRGCIQPKVCAPLDRKFIRAEPRHDRVKSKSETSQCHLHENGTIAAKTTPELSGFIEQAGLHRDQHERAKCHLLIVSVVLFSLNVNRSRH